MLRFFDKLVPRQQSSIILALIASIAVVVPFFIYVDSPSLCMEVLFWIIWLTGGICYITMQLVLACNCTACKKNLKLTTVLIALLNTASVSIFYKLKLFFESPDAYMPTGTELYFIKYAVYIQIILCFATAYYNLKSYIMVYKKQDNFWLVTLLWFLKFSLIQVLAFFALSGLLRKYIAADSVFIVDRLNKHIASYAYKGGYIDPRVLRTVIISVKKFCRIYKGIYAPINWKLIGNVSLFLFVYVGSIMFLYYMDENFLLY